VERENNPFESLGREENPATNSKPREPLTREKLERVKCLYSDGIRVNEIGRELKRSASSVSRALKKMKISKAVVIAKAGRLFDQKLNAVQELKDR
jgi:DNA invertase Pin-like site-specific DNA recombinase